MKTQAQAQAQLFDTTKSDKHSANKYKRRLAYDRKMASKGRRKENR